MIYKFVKNWLSISLCIYAFVMLYQYPLNFDYSRIPVFFQSKIIWIFFIGAFAALLNLIWLNALDKLNRKFYLSCALIGISAWVWFSLFNFPEFYYRKSMFALGGIWFLNLLIPLIKYHRLNHSLTLYKKAINHEKKSGEQS